MSRGDVVLKRLMDAALQVPTDTAVALSYNMIAAKDISADLAKTNRPMLYLYEPGTQDTADLLKSKLGDNVQLEIFENAGHALFVDEPERFNRVLEQFLQNLPK